MTQKIYTELDERVWREKLANGLHIQMIPKPEYARAYAFFATRYGGMDTRFCLNQKWTDTPAGIAHYLEHKMFDTKEGNALQELALNGAEPNAFTSNDMTGYYFSSTEKFEENLKILLSFVSVPYFTDESVAKEQGIIGQEIRMIEDNPDWQIYHQLLEALYTENPLRVSIAGTVESIADITAQTLYDCHRAFYTPGNMTLTVVGNIDPERVCALAQEILPAKSGPEIPRDYGTETLALAHANTRINMDVSATQFLLGFKCPPLPEGTDYQRMSFIGRLASEILWGESSPLYLRLYERGLINTTFGGDYEYYPNAAFLFAGGECREPEQVAQEILQEAERLVQNGIDPQFYEQTRRAALGQSIRSLNSFESIAIAETTGCFHHFDPFAFQQVFDTIHMEDIITFLKDNITASRMAISRIDPRD